MPPSMWLPWHPLNPPLPTYSFSTHPAIKLPSSQSTLQFQPAEPAELWILDHEPSGQESDIYDGVGVRVGAINLESFSVLSQTKGKSACQTSKPKASFRACRQVYSRSPTGGGRGWEELRKAPSEQRPLHTGSMALLWKGKSGTQPPGPESHNSTSAPTTT